MLFLKPSNSYWNNPKTYGDKPQRYLIQAMRQVAVRLGGHRVTSCGPGT